MENNKSSLLSVIIPNWNGAEFLPTLLDSIIQQTFSDWTVIVVDDQSTDDSLSILQSYHNKDNRITYKVRDRLPKGAQTCRNIGFDLSDGSKYVIFFDSDDVIAPYCFSQRIQYMEENADLDFAVAPAKTFRGNNLFDEDTTLYGYPFFPKEDTVKLFLEGTLPFVVWNNLYKRKSLIDYRIQWDENIKSKQDSAFNIISLLRGMKFEYIKNAKVDYYWRVAHNPNSITANIRKSSHLDSHIYYLNALIKELITAQFISYKNSLNAYLESFIPIFAAGKSKRHLNDLLNCEYLKKQRWFRFKLSILGYSLMYIVDPIHKGRIEWLLFPLLYRSRRKRVSQMKKQTKELTKIFQ